MELTDFIQQLLSAGTVSIKEELVSFDAADEEATIKLLQQYYTEDKLEMPLNAPAFDAAAALWAARYFYTAVQLTVLRDIDEATVNKKLVTYPGTITPSAIYSADLVLRYLPALLHLAKGLAPADVLVKVLSNTLCEWPFSSAGTELTAVKNEEIIFKDPSTRLAYIDRLVAARDAKRITAGNLQFEVLSMAGTHLNKLWPGGDLLLKNNTE